uniref:Uncharacterized protein n=1 Tax=Aegilops tauschii subsp. strangulata TaxID=200361 RepID=A0A453AC37_AEGTS
VDEISFLDIWGNYLTLACYIYSLCPSVDISSCCCSSPSSLPIHPSPRRLPLAFLLLGPRLTSPAFLPLPVHGDLGLSSTKPRQPPFHWPPPQTSPRHSRHHPFHFHSLLLPHSCSIRPLPPPFPLTPAGRNRPNSLPAFLSPALPLPGPLRPASSCEEQPVSWSWKEGIRRRRYGVDPAAALAGQGAAPAAAQPPLRHRLAALLAAAPRLLRLLGRRALLLLLAEKAGPPAPIPLLHPPPAPALRRLLPPRLLHRPAPPPLPPPPPPHPPRQLLLLPPPH